MALAPLQINNNPYQLVSTEQAKENNQTSLKISAQTREFLTRLLTFWGWEVEASEVMKTVEVKNWDEFLNYADELYDTNKAVLIIISKEVFEKNKRELEEWRWDGVIYEIKKEVWWKYYILLRWKERVENNENSRRFLAEEEKKLAEEEKKLAEEEKKLAYYKLEGDLKLLYIYAYMPFHPVIKKYNFKIDENTLKSIIYWLNHIKILNFPYEDCENIIWAIDLLLKKEKNYKIKKLLKEIKNKLEEKYKKWLIIPPKKDKS